MVLYALCHVKNAKIKVFFLRAHRASMILHLSGCIIKHVFKFVRKDFMKLCWMWQVININVQLVSLIVWHVILLPVIALLVIFQLLKSISIISVAFYNVQILLTWHSQTLIHSYVRFASHHAWHVVIKQYVHRVCQIIIFTWVNVCFNALKILRLLIWRLKLAIIVQLDVRIVKIQPQHVCLASQSIIWLIISLRLFFNV